LADGEIDVCFFNGGIRNSENEHIAKLLRRKSKLMVAFGACAHEGGIPGLANFYDPESIMERVYDTAPSNDDSAGTRPIPLTQVAEGQILLPEFYDRVKTLAQTVEVDYYMPGCPPVVDQIRNVFHALLEGKIPEPGAVIGADAKTNCDVCTRQKGLTGARVREFTRPHLVEADPDVCFLVQGLICSGPATRAGCGLPCINANMPCRGCYGPPEGVEDQGAKLLSAIAAIIDAETPEDVERIMDTIVDPVGTYFRFNLSDSILSELKYR
jgi:F420-non-reducing hydrogenase small subunit